MAVFVTRMVQPMSSGGVEIVTGQLNFSPKNGAVYVFSDGSQAQIVENPPSTVQVQKNSILYCYTDFSTAMYSLSGGISSVYMTNLTGNMGGCFFITDDFSIE